MALTKVAYLLGAGATHAEVLNLEEAPSALFISNNGLLISDVSKRVMKIAQKNSRFKKNVEEVTFREGPINIELLISLLESNQIPDSDFKVTHLKRLIQKDIRGKLSKSRRKKFYLHKALLELHSLTSERESLLGIISLNYDNLLDDAYEKIHDKRHNYCLTYEKGDGIPLLKLHGSFSWTNVSTYGKPKNISIIPLGINKNYLVPPYNFIWSRAFEILAQCDILRVIGCSLNQNDIGLVDLLFKAHLARREAFEIEIIDFQQTGDEIKRRYGFFRKILSLEEIEPPLVAGIPTDVGNPFKEWLAAKGKKMLGDDIDRTKFLRRCCESG
ncbi:MAG TPA: hypothetical protein VLX91_05180 [Candidatus Acidoferrales bacterium]|nr:hypothetical protein [Candidatus Acidoferrales bacterium]